MALNVTVTQAQANGFTTVYPCGGAVPNASNLNYLTGDTVPNSVITGLGTAGAICIYTSAAIHLIVDIAGYFADTTAFTPLPAPARVLDSRPAGDTVDGQFQRTGVLPAGTTLTLPIGGRAGVPPTTASVALNVTVTQAQANGFATVYPCGGAVPNASNLNYLTGDTVPNSVITGLGTAGAICIYTSAAIHLIVDIAGYFADTTAFTPLPAPARVLDSRPAGDTVDGQFQRTGAQAAFSVMTLNVGGRAGVPLNAGAVVLNVTVTDARSDGFATVFPPGSTIPNASNLNFRAGDTVPNSVITRIGSDGTICVFSSAGTHLIVDVAGYLTSTGGAPSAAGCPGSPSLSHAGADRLDDLAGPQVHLVYAIPSNGEDRSFDTDGSVARSIRLVQDWLAGQTGGQRLRLDTYGGQPDVTFVRLGKTDEYIAGFGPHRPRDGGAGSQRCRPPPARQDLPRVLRRDEYLCVRWRKLPADLDRPGAGVLLAGAPGRPGHLCLEHARRPRCDRAGYADIAMLHEFGHGLGLVPACAPHQYLGGHASDGANDLMWTGNQPWDVANVSLDLNRDDYYGHGRTDCPDMATSAFLTPTSGPTWLPAGWGSTPASQAPQYG